MPHRPRFTTVTVAVDFTPRSEVAVARAAWLPLERDATLSLLHPVPDTVPEAARGALMEEAARTLGRFAEDLRGRLRARGLPGVAVEPTAAAGQPFVEIIRHARSRGADLIVMGRQESPRQRGGVDEPTAERVIRKGDTPTLLVRRRAEGPYQRALLALDLSDASRRVGELALALLPDEVHALRVVHAFHVPFSEWLGAEALAACRRDCHEEAGAALRRVEAMFDAFGIQCRNVLREGDPRTVLLREAVRTGADLVVLGTHARSGVAHALLGSVAEWLVRSAPCDVAVTRPARYTFVPP